MFADQKYTKNPAADRAKVLRVTRQLPKLVLRVENFNKFVLLLGKKTKNDLAAYLHVGTVRDFKIRRSALRENMERATSDAAAADDELMDEAVDEWHDSEDEVLGDFSTENDSTLDDAEPTVASIERQLSVTDIAASGSASGTLIEANDAEITRPEVVLKNVAMINARSKRKRSLDERAPKEDVENVATATSAKAVKKKKVRKPLVINKDVLKKTHPSLRSKTSTESP